LETITTYYRVDRKEISYLKFILEAYDGIAGLTTIDPASGLIVLRTAPGCEQEVGDVLNGLGKEILIEPVEDIEQYDR
jgi:hypothetical protein